MTTLPSASTTVADSAGAQSSGTDLICVLAPVATSADMVPRVMGSAAAILAQYGFSDGLEYCALHFAQTGKPVLFVGLPITTPGVVGRVNTNGNTGTSAVTVAAGGSGVLGEHVGVIKVASVNGGSGTGTIGTDQITLSISLDGGRNFNPFRLGTNNSYTTTYHGVTVSFAAGTLVTGDTIVTWFGSQPLSSNSGWATAFTNLAAQQLLFRDTILIGDIQGSTDATNYLAQLNNFASASQRFIYGRASAADLSPLATLSSVSHSMTGAPSLTFATAVTCTRAAGSWINDGFAIGDTVTFSGTVSNNVSVVITGLTATVITVAAGLTTETAANAAAIGRPSLVFNAAAHTITRNTGSWIADGFNVGDAPTIAGSVSNNGVAPAVSALTPLVMTFASGMVNETVATNVATVTKGQTLTAWMSALNATYSAIVGFRLDIAAGRGRIPSPFTGWLHRRSAAWAASLREFTPPHDIMTATFRKSDGPTGFSLLDVNGNLVEWDDRVNGGAACLNQFTSLRSWANGPTGAFVTASITRDAPSSLLSATNNVAVVNLACSVSQAATENAFVGVSFALNGDGTITTDALATATKYVNDQLELSLLGNATGEGARLSSAVWTPSGTDVVNVPDASVTGTLAVNLLGTIYHVNTTVKVRTGG